MLGQAALGSVTVSAIAYVPEKCIKTPLTGDRLWWLSAILELRHITKPYVNLI